MDRSGNNHAGQPRARKIDITYFLSFLDVSFESSYIWFHLEYQQKSGNN